MTEDTCSAGRGPASDERACNVVPFRRPPAHPTAVIGPERLLTCSLALEHGAGSVNGFFAAVTRDEVAFCEGLVERYGAEAAGSMRYGVGRGWSSAVSDMMVSGCVAEMLRAAAAEPDREDCRGFRIALELSFLK